MVPLIPLTMVMITFGFANWIKFSCIIIVSYSALLWLLGRPGVHVGLSGVVFGYFGFLLVSAWLKPSLLIVILLLIIMYYFGSMLFGILPTSEKTSWEAHLFGLIAGCGCAYLDYEKLINHLW